MTGPRGTTRETWLVLVLSLVTFGIYNLYYWWVVSRDVDAYAQRPNHSHKLVKIGTLILVGAIVGALVLIVPILAAIITVSTAQADPGPEVLGALVGYVGLLFLLGAVYFGGAIVRLVGKYRMWELVEADERRRNVPSPLSAGIMLLLALAGWFVPFVGVVMPFVILYMTQEHLNAAWR